MQVFLFTNDRLVTFVHSITSRSITKNRRYEQSKYYRHICFERQTARVCNKSRSHKCSPTIVTLFHHGQQGHTPKSDKLMILSTISYLVFPVDLISAKRLPIIGWIDEAFSLSVAYQKVCKNITPEIERKTDALLDKWFPEYTNYIEMVD